MLNAREGPSAITLLERFPSWSTIPSNKSFQGLYFLPCERWRLTVWRKIIDQIQVVCSKIWASKWCSWWDSKPSRSTSSQWCIEIRCNGQSGCVSIIPSTSDRLPDDVDSVRRLIVWVCGLAEQICGTTTSDVDLQFDVSIGRGWAQESIKHNSHLLCIVSGCNKDNICISVIGQTCHSYSHSHLAPIRP